LQSLREPNTVAAIIDALRQVHGDALARLMLIEGVTLADLICSLRQSPIKNREAVKLITDTLVSGDFIVEPEIAAVSHLAYIYDPPKSLHVVDVAIETPDGTIPSTEIRLRLRDLDAV
jgi:hypothetical protein